jgi:hypothetical protein
MKKLTTALCCLTLTLAAVAQDGAPVGAPKKDDKAATPPALAKAEPAKQDAKLSKEAEEWVTTLAKRITDKDAVIRDTSIAGVEKAGKPALPILNILATGQDKVLAEAAKKLAEKIEKGAPAAGRMDRTAAVDDLAKKLNLDEKKTQKLKDAQKTSQDKFAEIMDAMRNGEMQRDEVRAAMEEAREEIKSDLKKNGFTDDEIKQIEQSMMQGRRMGGGGGGRRGEGGGGGGGAK